MKLGVTLALVLSGFLLSACGSEEPPVNRVFEAAYSNSLPFDADRRCGADPQTPGCETSPVLPGTAFRLTDRGGQWTVRYMASRSVNVKPEGSDVPTGFGVITEFDLTLDRGEGPPVGIGSPGALPLRVAVLADGSEMETCGELLDPESGRIVVGETVKLRSCFEVSGPGSVTPQVVVGQLIGTGNSGGSTDLAWFEIQEPRESEGIPDLDALYTGGEPAPYDLANLYHYQAESPFPSE